MVIQELETALRSDAPITVCIMDNAQLQFIRDNQRFLFGSCFLSTEFPELDFASIANAFGCEEIRVEQSGGLDPPCRRRSRVIGPRWLTCALRVRLRPTG